MNNTKLSNDLRDLAEKYFNDINSIETGCGICYALAQYRSDAYESMQILMQELGDFAEDAYGYYSYYPKDWEPRAYMCLFLAEYLENK